MGPPTATIRKVAVPIIVTAIATVMAYPGILTLARGAPLEDGITQIVVGLLTLLLYIGFKLIDRILVVFELGARAESWAILALLAAVIGINAVLIYTVPDSVEAVGLLVVCIIGALIVLIDPNGKRSNSEV